jgi:hypothetical protein
MLKGYLFPNKPAETTVHNIRWLMKEIDKEELKQDLRNGLLLLTGAIFLLDASRSRLAYAGAEQLAAAGVINIVACIWLRSEYATRDNPPAINKFLIEEREWILERLSTLTDAKNWSLVLFVFGYALWILSMGHLLIHWFWIAIGSAALYAAIETFHYLSVRKPLRIRLEDIDLRIARLNASTT